MMRARLCWGIRETLCGGQVRSETRMRDCLNRVGVAIISKFPHLAPPPAPTPSPRGSTQSEPPADVGPKDGRGVQLRSGRVRGAVVRARDARASSGSVELLGDRDTLPRLPLVNPKPPRCASVERWCGSLSGGGRVDLTTHPST